MPPEQRARGEDGYAVVVAIVLVSVLMVMTTTMLAIGTHLNVATVRDSNWNAALQVAEAGIDRALYELTADPGWTGTGDEVVTLPNGEAQILVTPLGPGRLAIYSTGWTPARASAQARQRRIRVEFAPAKAFDFALFSLTGLSVGAGNGVTRGDVFANGSIALENTSEVVGSVTSATGTVSLANGAKVRKEDDRLGNVYSGGYDLVTGTAISLANTAVIEGSAFAQAEQCPGTAADDSRYHIAADGVVEGDASARGAIGGTVLGSRTSFVCQARAATRTLPQFTWDPSLYDGEQEFTSLESFQLWVDANQSSLGGVVRLWDPACSTDPSGAGNVISTSGATVVDDFVMVTNCRVDAENNFTVAAPADAVVNIVVQNPSTTPSAVSIKNNFTVEAGAAVLLYSTGLITVKNDFDETGAVYAGAISVKNTMEVTYDPRVERTLGFGDVKYERRAWQECRASATGTAC